MYAGSCRVLSAFFASVTVGDTLLILRSGGRDSGRDRLDGSMRPQEIGFWMPATREA